MRKKPASLRVITLIAGCITSCCGKKESMNTVPHRRKQQRHCKKRENNVIDGGTRHYVDTNALKSINSNQIVSFYCKFSTTDRLKADTVLAGNIFTLNVTQNCGSMEVHNSAEEHQNRTFIPVPEFFVQLQQIVSEYDFAQYNGQFYKVAGLPPDHGAELEIRYASDERIQSSDNQNCFLSVKAMEELVALFQHG